MPFMKHNLRISLFLVFIFLVSQIFGIAVFYQYFNIEKTSKEGKTVINEEAYSITGTEPLKLENEDYAWLVIAASIFIGTLVMLLIMKLKKPLIMKYWLFFAVFYSIVISIAPFVKNGLAFLSGLFDIGSVSVLAGIISYIIAFFLAFYKFKFKSPLIHNLSEILVYPGIAIIVLSFTNLYAAFFLLLIISAYDMYAVWKSRHMVKMAKFQAEEARVFAGLMLEYKAKRKNAGSEKKIKKALVEPEKAKALAKKGKERAILGGGDIAFPMLFSGAMLKSTADPASSLLVAFFSAFALMLLFLLSKPKKFYPAMPFLSAGCFVGYLAYSLFF